ncbi:MAG: efflux RND transporter permease subunit [Desulfuromonadales bacterium]
MLSKLVGKNCDLICRYPFLYLAVLVLLTGFFGYYYATLPTETSVESLVIDDDPDLVFYETFKEQFGEDEVLVVGFSAKDVFEPAVIGFIIDQTRRLEAIDGVANVLSLANVDDFVGSDNDFIVQPLLADIPPVGLDQESLRQRALASSLIRDNLLNSASTAALFLVRPEARPENPAFDEQFVSRIEESFRDLEVPWPGFEYHIAGWLATDVNLSRFMNRDMMVFMPLTFTFLIVLVGLALRNRWSIVLAMINVSVCLIWTLAFLNLIGGVISPITSILPPLIMALAVSDSIHIFDNFLKQDRRQAPITDIMKTTLERLAVPCFLTSFTTAIGFASLAVSDVPPIRHFGLAAAGGMMAEFVLSMTLIPLGLYFLRHKTGLKAPSIQSSSLLHSRLERFAGKIPAHRKLILGTSAGLILFSLLGASGIKVETNLLEYFKESSSVYQDSQFVDRMLGGVETIEVSLQAPEPDMLLEPQALAILQQIEDYLQRQPVVSQVTSIGNFLREMNKAFHQEDETYFRLPDSRAMAAQYLLLYDGEEIDNFIDSERTWARVSARITEHRTSAVAGYIDDLQGYLDEITADSPYQARVTGKTLIANKLISLIVNSQVQSLSLAFFLIFLLMFAIFRSLKLGLLAMVPNVLPILFNFAMMGFCGIPLNSATAIIAAVAIGIAVDDTIHFICEYQHQRTQQQTVTQAVQLAIINKGSPIITTSLIMTGGFGILLFASFVPTIQFGFLSALIMLFAVVSDLLVLPVLLLKFDA